MTVHIVPVGDVVDHQLDDECVCGPEQDPVHDDDGILVGWLALHASLDGRERRDIAGESPGWEIIDAPT